jgi:hypothetical protein
VFEVFFLSVSSLLLSSPYFSTKRSFTPKNVQGTIAKMDEGEFADTRSVCRVGILNKEALEIKL